MADAGLLSIKITADDAQLIAALARSRSAVKATDDQILESVATFGKLGGAALAAALVIGEEMVRASIDAADALNKQSQAAGVTAESLSELQFAAKFADVSNEDLTAGLVKLSKAAREAATGTGAQATAFATLGVKVTDANGKIRSADELLKDVAESFKNMEDGNQKTTTALDLFGRSGAALIPLLNSGSAGLADMAEKARITGNVISNETAAGAEVFNDSISLLKANVTGLGNTLVADMLPALNRITAAMNDAAQNQGLLKAAFVGFGGIIKETFSRENFTPLEQAKAQFNDLTKELELSKQQLQGFEVGGNLSQIDAMKDKIAELEHQIELTTQWRNELLNPPKEAPPLKLQGPDISSVLAMNNLLGKSLEADMKKYEELEEKQRRQSQAINEQIGALKLQGATMGQSASAVEIYKLQMKGATQSQIDAAKAAYATIDAFNATKEIGQIKVGAQTGNDKQLGELQEKYTRLNQIIAQNPQLQQQAGEAAAALAQQYQNSIDAQTAAGLKGNEDFLQQMADRAKIIEESNLNEIDLAQKKHEAEQEELDTFLLNGVLTEQKYQELSMAQQQAHDDNMRNMRLKSWKDLESLSGKSWDTQASIVTNSLIEMSSQLANKSRLMFEINKRATEANIVLKTIESVQSAFAWGMLHGGPIVAAGAALVAGAYGAIQIAAVESTSFGSSKSTGTSGVPSAQVGASPSGDDNAARDITPQHQKLAVSGLNSDALFSGDMVKSLAKKLLDFQKDGGVVVLS